jgi:hypothetical protein
MFKGKPYSIEDRLALLYNCEYQYLLYLIDSIS